MEGSALFNDGFLGNSFYWWIGQIADDSEWRDNILPGKFEDKNSIPGWGRRYKVRIMGLHDKEEETIPSEQLPWANVMYPITAGGGQTKASQTPNLRQGNFVFGFFLDGQEQEVPVIMGILGNNAQTELKKTIGNDDSNFAPTSGYSEGRVPKEGTRKEVVPDEGLVTSGAEGGAEIEDPDSVHRLTVGDVKLETRTRIKAVVLKPDDIVTSSLKGIQTVIDNLTEAINGYLSAISSYIDAASSVISDIQKLLSDAACEIAKYMKIFMDKIMEYVMKTLNQALCEAVALLPADTRYLFADIKEIITELILCLYNKITEGLCAMIEGILNDIMDLENAEEKARDNVDDPLNDQVNRKPEVPMCVAEDLVGQILYANKDILDESNNNLLDNVNSFFDDINSELAGVSDQLGDISSLVGDITGSITAALSFTNLKLSIFGCELSPNVAVSDFYTLATGGEAQPDSAEPSNASVEQASNRENEPPLEPAQETPYASPTSTQPDVNLTSTGNT
jgi:hypothetical protein